MPAPTSAIKTQSNRVKAHILTRFLKLADKVDEKGEGDLSDNEKGMYKEMLLIFAKNVIPRSQEISGEDGEPIKLVFDSAFKPNATTSETEGNSPESSPVQDS